MHLEEEENLDEMDEIGPSSTPTANKPGVGKPPKKVIFLVAWSLRGGGEAKRVCN